MKPRHHVSRTAIELIKRFEGYRRKAAQLPDGRWTIGYGHTLTARQGAEVSEDDAEALLLYDLLAVAKAVNELTFTPLTQNQFDALCAFAFNIGVESFRASRVLKQINEGALIQAACGMELWRKAEFEGEVILIDALVRRRASEKALFLTPPGGAWVPVPSAVLKPGLDIEAEALVPASPPAPVVTSLEGEAVRVLREDEPAPRPLPPEGESPVTAAAEAVTARLATVFPDEPAAPAVEPEPEPELHLEEARPQADFAPPITVDTGGEDAAGPEAEPFELVPPEPAVEEAPELVIEESEPERVVEGAAAPDLFDHPAPANDARAAEAPSADEAEAAARERVVIDDTAPYEFIPTPVQPLQRPKDGYLSLVSLAVLGLAFFAGGLFWAVNAQAGLEQPAWMSPKVVGALACVAGVGFFSIALFLLLQRLGQAAERSDANPRI